LRQDKGTVLKKFEGLSDRQWARLVLGRLLQKIDSAGSANTKYSSGRKWWPTRARTLTPLKSLLGQAWYTQNHMFSCKQWPNCTWGNDIIVNMTSPYWKLLFF